LLRAWRRQRTIWNVGRRARRVEQLLKNIGKLRARWMAAEEQRRDQQDGE
jgi:hypothetical protein